MQRMDKYSENKAIYINIKKLTSCIHHIINMHIYLYYMCIKYYFTHPENQRKR